MGYFVSAGIAMAVVLRTAHGVFHAASSNASATWVTDIIPARRMGEGLGIYGLSMAVSTAVAPALGLAVMNEWGFKPLFGLASAVALPEPPSLWLLISASPSAALWPVCWSRL